ncbi:cellulose synthase [Nonomuraea fuscirosea]|uniref:cellulose synthase n=1 Tax=Nonomuraea fuscirosea TaxID=1291556 RepID=UPI002DDC3A21|nr:cellulose synthase [Nonomuraea fuscirosea]WSA55511.1 cellulose synthase [Nonomuraea fuscirosea]
METFNAIAWLPLCAGVTIAGLVLAFLTFRRRGAAAGMRMTAWALLPVAAYLTGALQTLWTVGSAVVSFVTSLVFNPTVWIGVAVAGLSAVLFVVSGVMRGRKLSAGRGLGRKKRTGGDTPGTEQAVPPAQAAPAVGQKPAAGQKTTQPLPKPAPRKAAKADDDFSDIEELLKRRGIS